MKETALVIGHAGFVGRHLVPELKRAGYEVTTTEDFYSFTQDYRSKKRFDVVAHLGANIVNVTDRMRRGIRSFEDVKLDYEVCRWVEEWKPKQCFVVMSSCAVDYPDDPYCMVKRLLEAMALNMYKLRGVPSMILRPYSGYGADQSEHYPFRAIMDRALNGENPLTVWGGSQERDWLHIDDLIAAIMYGIEKFPRGVPVDIGTGIGTDFYMFAAEMARAVRGLVDESYHPRIVGLSEKESSSTSRVAGTRLARGYGWVPRITLREGIMREMAKAIRTRNGQLETAGATKQ